MSGPTPLQAACQRVLSHFPRFSPLFLRLDIQVIPDSREAFVTDDLRLGLGSRNLVDVAVGAGTLMHELFHILLAHFNRRGTRDPDRWNVATDIVINETLEQMFRDTGGKFKTEPDWLFARTFGFTFTNQVPTAEQVYDMLPEGTRASRKCGSGSGNLNGSEAQLSPRSDPKTFEEVQIAIDQTMVELAGAGNDKRYAGTGTAEFRLWKGVKPRESTVRWDEELGQVVGLEHAAYLGKNRVADWRRPNRRGYDLAGSQTTAPDITVVSDTSGSMGPDGAVVLGQIASIITAFGPTRVLTCDTSVKSDVVVSSVAEFMEAAQGGGGTDMTPALELVQDGIILCITDGELFGEPRYDRVDDVIWVITRRDGKQPWMRKAVLAYGS